MNDSPQHPNETSQDSHNQTDQELRKIIDNPYSQQAKVRAAREELEKRIALANRRKAKDEQGLS